MACGHSPARRRHCEAAEAISIPGQQDLLLGDVTGTGAWLGYLLAGRQERRRDNRLYVALCKALLAEVEVNAWQAKFYPERPVLGTAYRLETTDPTQ